MTDVHQSIRDEEHLKIAMWAMYIIGSIEVFIGLFPLLHIFVGGAIFTGSFAGSTDEALFGRFFGGMFMVIGIFVLVFVQALAISKILAARWISQRRHRVPIMIAAVATCLSIPYGTILGVCTILLLNRESVIQLFDQSDSSSTATTS